MYRYVCARVSLRLRMYVSACGMHLQTKMISVPKSLKSPGGSEQSGSKIR